MKNLLLPVIYAFSLVILITSCNSNQGRQNTAAQTDSLVSGTISPDSIAIKDGGIPIFYNMYLSVEMSSLFQSIGATFNPALINSPDNASGYEASSEKAVNLGVYAVDLSYSKYFDQFEEAGKYLKNMHNLAVDLGIPDDKFYVSVKRIESNITNKDSLVLIANEIYATTENYLKQNDRESAASLIIAGGWIEAMQIASRMVADPAKDILLVERIADQKVSIDNLITLLVKFKDEPYIRDLLVKLSDIKESLDQLRVTGNRVDNATAEKLREVSLKIQSLRKEIVS